LRAIGEHAGADLVERVDRQPGGIGGRLQQAGAESAEPPGTREIC
jgi:hypothetical protein